MKANLLLFMLLTGDAWARDPFLPAPDARCPAGELLAPPWQLQGVIGRAGHFEAWLLHSAGSRQRIRPDDRLAGTSWQATHIDLKRVSLVDTGTCQSRFELVLKGEHHVKENRSDSVDD